MYRRKKDKREIFLAFTFIYNPFIPSSKIVFLANIQGLLRTPFVLNVFLFLSLCMCRHCARHRGVLMDKAAEFVPTKSYIVVPGSHIYPYSPQQIKKYDYHVSSSKSSWISFNIKINNNRISQVQSTFNISVHLTHFYEYSKQYHVH